MLLIAQAERRPEDFQIAIGLQQRGLHDEAADYLERFLQQQPRHALGAEAQYRLAQARIELDQPDRAIAALRASLQLGGRDFALRAEARYRLGNLLEQKREHEAALQQFEALVAEVAAEHYLVPAAHYAAGEARRELGDDGAAAEAFTQAAKGATGERADFRLADRNDLFAAVQLDALDRNRDSQDHRFEGNRQVVLDQPPTCRFGFDRVYAVENAPPYAFHHASSVQSSTAKPLILPKSARFLVRSVAP
jgi:tetratricopeptide (TPR) repeat protein